MPLDPQTVQVLEQVAALGLPPLYTVSPAQARAAVKLRPREPGPEVARVDERVVPGAEVPVRVYTPAGAGPFPVLMWFHGGGWVVGDLDTADGTARRLTASAGCITVSVGYRLAPETKFPGPLEDCFAATTWAVENAAEIGADPQRFAVGGDSAGGNLAAAVTLMARERGAPHLIFQLLVYPVMDCNFDTASYRDNAEGYLLTREGMQWFWSQYLRDPTDANQAYAAPLQAENLRALPAAAIITAEYDPLRDEGEAYAERLRAAGVPVQCSRYSGVIHGFFGMPKAVAKGQQAVAEATAALRDAFAAGFATAAK